MDPGSNILILTITILLSAFFSGVEIAFVTSNKFKLELDKAKNNFTGTMLRLVTKSPSRLLGTLLIGNNISLVIYSIVMEGIIEEPIRGWYFPVLGEASGFAVLLTQTIISTIIILVAGEFIPKALFRINPNPVFNFVSGIVAFFHYLLAPIVRFTIWISKIILKYIFRAQMEEEAVSFERTDLDYYLRQISDEKEGSAEHIENEVKILQNALSFPSIRAKECMIPRTEIVGLEQEESPEVMKSIFIRTGLSKIMIYRDTIDDIIGYVHSFAMFRKPASLKEVLLPVLIVPETMLVKDILTQLIQQRRSMAVVVDEYGGTSGILTIEDIIEEIIGEIEDEHDKEDFTEKKLNDTEFIFSARLEIDYLNEAYGLELPESEEYETLAGLILRQTQHIPLLNELVRVGRYQFTVRKASETRIEEVHIRVLPETEA